MTYAELGQHSMPTLNRAGVKLFYEEWGSGSPPIVLLHGLTCNHALWAPQVEHFRATHRIVAPDARGHGASDKPEQVYSMSVLADDLAWLCDRLPIDRPVVIGHSMGGVVALQFAASFPDRPSAVVILDSPIVPPQSTRDSVAPLLDRLRGPGWREAQRTLAELCFLPTSDPALKSEVLARIAAPQHVMVSALESLFSCDTAAAATACKVPVLYLAAAHTASDLSRFRELCPHLVTGQTVGAGHYHHLEVPEQVNAMIERFLAVSGL